MSEKAHSRADISETGDVPAERPDRISQHDDELKRNPYNLLLEELEAATTARARVLADNKASLGAMAESSVREQAARIAVAAFSQFNDVG